VLDKNFHFKEFCNLDNSPDADYLMASMDVMYSLDSIQTIKKRSVNAMNLQAGDLVLEVACGTGEDAELAAEIVGKSGAVTAIDLSKRMIAEARRRSTHSNVAYAVEDATKLNYANDSFSACHADRFLVSHADYKSLFKEIIRVVKPGGTICITDVDALSIGIYPYTQATQIILAQLHESFVNPFMGRALPHLFVSTGLQDVKVTPEISIIRSFEVLNKIFQFSKITKESVKKGHLTQEASEKWFEEMYSAEKTGGFLYCLTLFTVSGRVRGR
jgi:ubiquinone/menaquinone biosynthesis C-methylase UbiE